MIFSLGRELYFPDPELADEDGLLAGGGDLSPDRLLLAYSTGIFPWYGANSPILWWSPDPRMVLFPDRMKVSKSLRLTIQKKKFTVRFDSRFEDVMTHCAGVKRKGEQGTWITRKMIRAYCELHEMGYAHSAEAYCGGQLAGGLYGVSLGKAFFGESMFFLERDASKVAFYHLVELLKKWEFHFIDAQVETEHLKQLGARNITRTAFLGRLWDALQHADKKGKWLLLPP